MDSISKKMYTWKLSTIISLPSWNEPIGLAELARISLNPFSGTEAMHARDYLSGVVRWVPFFLAIHRRPQPHPMTSAVLYGKSWWANFKTSQTAQVQISVLKNLLRPRLCQMHGYASSTRASLPSSLWSQPCTPSFPHITLTPKLSTSSWGHSTLCITVPQTLRDSKTQLGLCKAISLPSSPWLPHPTGTKPAGLRLS